MLINHYKAVTLFLLVYGTEHRVNGLQESQQLHVKFTHSMKHFFRFKFRNESRTITLHPS